MAKNVAGLMPQDLAFTDEMKLALQCDTPPKQQCLRRSQGKCMIMPLLGCVGVCVCFMLFILYIDIFEFYMGELHHDVRFKPRSIFQISTKFYIKRQSVVLCHYHHLVGYAIPNFKSSGQEPSNKI